MISFATVIYLILLLYLMSDLTTAKPQCPLREPCSCVWDKIGSIPLKDKRNELVCSDKGLTEQNLPFANSAEKNMTFYKVNMSHNHFDHIPVDFVDSLMGIEFVDFSFNTLEELPDAMMDLPDLTKFYLSENKLATIDERRFVNMSNLLTLMLDNNRLVSLQAGAFLGLKTLNHLTLSSNQLESIAENTFQDLHRLDYLSLHNNHLTALSPGTFVGLDTLHTLRLDRNKLKTLPDNIFSPLSSLKRLDIDVNKLESLEATAFVNLSKLKTLYLSSNMITKLPENFFSKMTDLQHLDLSRNSISSITPAIFGNNSQFKSMQWLDLSKNKDLTSFPEDFFTRFPNLEVLELSGLHLKYLPHLGALNKLEALLIDDTLIATIYPCDFVGLSSLSELYWDDAPIDCSCQSLWMRNWTEKYMKERPKVARLNPKGSLPDWEWECRKPMLLVNKDFRQLQKSQISDQCEPGEKQQWCHELKTVPIGNLSLTVKSSETTLNLSWKISEIATANILHGYQLTIQKEGATDIQSLKFYSNATNTTINDLEPGITYNICVEVLGWGGSILAQKCQRVTITARKTHYALVVILSIALVIILVAVSLLLFVFVKKRGIHKEGKANAPSVSFTNQLAGEAGISSDRDHSESAEVEFTGTCPQSEA